ncbi:MAG: hypothetical protein HQ515_19585, partial [Phycisphaeraceae bacterium]|nr:hypothetical protein [Phycisphaeraceae bacterium]
THEREQLESDLHNQIAGLNDHNGQLQHQNGELEQLRDQLQHERDGWRQLFLSVHDDYS